MVPLGSDRHRVGGGGAAEVETDLAAQAAIAARSALVEDPTPVAERPHERTKVHCGRMFLDTRTEDHAFEARHRGLYTAIARHTVLVCAALAACAVTAGLLRDRAGSKHPNQSTRTPPAGPGLIPFTYPERLIAGTTTLRPTRPHQPLGELARRTPSSTITLVSQTCQTRPQHRDHPGQLVR